MKRRRSLTIEDLGFERQPPSRTYAVTIDSSLQAADGQRLGYGWTGIVENWHERAFTSFGDGHGMWERGGGPLPSYARNFSELWKRSAAAVGLPLYIPRSSLGRSSVRLRSEFGRTVVGARFDCGRTAVGRPCSLARRRPRQLSAAQSADAAAYLCCSVVKLLL